MGCSTNVSKNNKFNHEYLLSSLLNTLKPNLLIPPQLFEQYASSFLLQLNDYNINIRKSQNIQNLLSRCKLILLCSSKSIYDKDFYGSIQGLHHPLFNQIQKDVHRTYPEQIFFKSEENIKKFQRVLRHIAIYFPQKGYMQGFNFIVGFFFLIGASQQQVFWMFVNLALLPNFLLLGLFQEGFPLAEVYYTIFDHLLQTYFLKLYKKIERIGLPKQTWVFTWFLTYFLYSFPFEVVIMLWEFILINGGTSIIYLSLGLISEIQKELLELQEDQGTFSHFFQKFSKIQQFQKMKINFKRVFDFGQRIICSNAQIKELSKNCHINHKYIKFFSEYYQNDQKYQDYLVKLQQKRKRFATNKKNPVSNENYIKSNYFGERIHKTRSLLHEFQLVLRLQENYSVVNPKQSEQIGTIGESRSFSSDSIEKQSFNF